MECKTHIEKVLKMSSACYAVTFVYHFSTTDTIKIIYFAYFNSTMKYGIIFWGNSTDGKGAWVTKEHCETYDRDNIHNVM
jgi:hypothetical protein